MSSDSEAPPQNRYLRSRRSGEPTVPNDQHPDASLDPLDWISPNKVYDETDTFLPYPGLAFLSDKNLGLTCSICKESKCVLQYVPDACDLDLDNCDTIPGVLPCGHFAGLQCLNRWVFENMSCPFCKLNLVYETCGHVVAPHLIVQDTMHLIPETLPAGGSCADECVWCLKTRGERNAARQRRLLAWKLQEAQEKLRATGKQADRQAVLDVKQQFDDLRTTDNYNQLSHRSATEW